MTFVSNDPSWWPTIDFQLIYSYWIVAAGVVVVYDWVLTIGQEIELIWIRYIGMPFSVVNVLEIMPFASLTDTGCNILNYALNWTNIVMTAMLDVIMIARLYAMYQGSRTMLIFLVITFLSINICCVVLAAIGFMNVVAVWMLNTVWEVLALCLSVWIAVKHFRELRRLGPSTGSAIGDCLKVLIQSHVLYFASLSPALLDSDIIVVLIFDGTRAVLLVMQMFVLGPRLILSVREYHAKLVAGSDADTSMNSIVFQEHIHISTSGTV
ncbi:hypothetical protein EDD22DRAFT_851716 [Suillus occidentalis]|nr:hypothetical protein EDD22DRAFT_851716 [Suillus occidentalis]